MMGKEEKTVTCSWITTDDVSEDKCKADTIEGLLEKESIIKIFEHRCNKLVQENAMGLGAKMAESENKFEVWNNGQILGGI